MENEFTKGIQKQIRAEISNLENQIINKELEAENEEQKCSDCGIVKEYYSRINELELEISTWERRYLDISNEKDTALAEKITLADSMRSCLLEREKLIKKLIGDIVDLKAENDRLNKWKNLITNLKGEGEMKGATMTQKQYYAKMKKEILRSGCIPVKAIQDEAGNCIICGECGRCPGWHTSGEEQLASLRRVNNAMEGRTL